MWYVVRNEETVNAAAEETKWEVVGEEMSLKD